MKRKVVLFLKILLQNIEQMVFWEFLGIYQEILNIDGFTSLHIPEFESDNYNSYTRYIELTYYCLIYYEQLFVKHFKN